MLTSMSIVKERETGTIEQIIVSPIKPVELIAGKTVPFIMIGFVDIFIITIVAIAWFNVPFNGSFLFLLFSSFLYILSTIAVGLFISTISRTQQQSMLSFFLFFMPAILLSGFIFPIYSMPESIQLITYANPLRYFMTIIRGIFLKGVGFEALWKDIGALFIIGITLIILSAKRFSKRLE
jgi:ABC-2 type transport system permease protein